MLPFFMQFFKPIRNLALGFTKSTFDKILYEITQDRKTKELIIKLNTRKQLFGKGVDSTGRRLDAIGGKYTEYTIRIKRSDNLPTDRVTLFQTGDFYNSFRITPFRGGFTIDANTIKEGEDLQTRWGNQIIGLTDESKTELAQYYIREIQQQLATEILR